MEDILTLSGVAKSYGSHRALLPTDLRLPRGKIIGLLGPNGSGKSTLLKLIAGLLVPTEGEIRIAGNPPGEKALSHISYLPERNSLPLSMTAGELLDYFAAFYADFDREAATEMIASLGVPMDRPLRAFSKGNREKLQLSLIMSRRTDLYLLDEPIGGVDPAARDFALSILRRLCHSEATVLISTHLIADVEPILDEYIFIQSGRLIRYGEVSEAVKSEGKSLDLIFREVFRC